MKKSQILEIDGVFPAVKCTICDTFYPAESDDFAAFYGSVTRGLEDVLVGVSPPKRPAKRAITVVCRDPHCVGTLARMMMRCDGEGKEAAMLWAQVLTIWAKEAGHELVESAETQPAPPPKKLRRA